MRTIAYWFDNRFTTRNHASRRLITVTVSSIHQHGSVYRADVAN